MTPNFLWLSIPEDTEKRERSHSIHNLAAFMVEANYLILTASYTIEKYCPYTVSRCTATKLNLAAGYQFPACSIMQDKVCAMQASYITKSQVQLNMSSYAFYPVCAMRSRGYAFVLVSRDMSRCHNVCSKKFPHSY